MGQEEIFEGVDAELAELLAGRETLSDADTRAWPKILASLVDVMVAHYRRRGRSEDAARDEAEAAVITLAHYLGGRVFYLPRDTRLRLALRDTRIWAEFSGNNAPELAERYNLTLNQIYNILREQRALHRKRHEPELF